MKLVEKVLENLPQDTVTHLSQLLNVDSVQISSALNALIPGVLSAFKAKLVTDMSQGNATGFLDIVSHFTGNTSTASEQLNTLFAGNSDAMDTLTQRVSAFSGMNVSDVQTLLPAALPTIMTGVVDMVKSVGVSSAITSGSELLNSFLSEKNASSPYETAIAAANKFIGSVFGGSTQAKMNANIASDSVEADAPAGGDFVHTIIELFDQDNDGSVMDDIYNMLVKH
jgi:hypothetical protein